MALFGGFATLRLSGLVIPCRQCIRQYSMTQPLFFRLTPAVWAEPPKRRRRVDPTISKTREDRRRRKIEKQIRQLEKVGKKLKPIDELEVPPKLEQQKQLRFRGLPKLTEDEIDFRSAVYKEWSRYKNQQSTAEMRRIDSMMEAQAKALAELKVISEELYEEALQPDPLILNSYKAIGPVFTPPIDNYVEIDGEYVDVTKKWE